MSGEAKALKLCVNGNLGSGKSTVAKRLAERMGLEYFATGRIQRELAESLGISILELNQRAEKDKSIDTLLDARFEPIAAAHERIVFDSRLAWNFVPHAVRARLVCHPATSAARIFGDKDSSRGVEVFESLEAAQASVAERRASERKRFLDLYKVDIEDLGNYDFVAQTDQAAPDAVIEALEAWLDGPRPPGTLMLNPRMVFPLKGADADASHPLTVAQAGDCYFAATGAALLAAAVRAGENWVEARRVSEPALGGQSEAAFAKAKLDPALLERWQADFGFTFTVAPEL